MQLKQYVFKSVKYAESVVELDMNVWYDPPSVESDPRPIAIYFHSGGFVVGSKDTIPPLQIELLLQLGFVVISPAYRLCPTIDAVAGPLQDCLDSYAWVTQKLPALLRDEDVEVDKEKIVTLGSSCGGTLAHLMTKSPNPPRAILDIAGMKYLSESFYHQGTMPPGYEELPDLEQKFLDKVWEEVPPPISTPFPWNAEGAMDFSKPRFAWMFSAGSKGTHYSGIVPDGDTAIIDPAALFSTTGYPSTCFLHGTADSLVNVNFAKRGYQDLKDRGVDVELILVEGADHGFDAEAGAGSAEYDFVKRAFEWLAFRVK